MKQWIGLCSVCWALAAGTVWAAPQETALDEVTVTATRTENTVREVPLSSEVITRADMDRLGAYSIRSALRLAENVNLTEGGMTGNQVMIRGMNSIHTLILVDGQRIAGEDTSETANVYELDRISLADVERIEILRSTASALYGSDAMGGVINIITKTPGRKIFETAVHTGTAETGTSFYFSPGRDGRFSSAFSADFSQWRQYLWRNSGLSPSSGLHGPRQNFSFSGRYDLSDRRYVDIRAGYMQDRMRMDYQDDETGYARGKYQNIYSQRETAGLSYHGGSARSEWTFDTYWNRLNKKETTMNHVVLGDVVSPDRIPKPEQTDDLRVFDFDRGQYDTFVTGARDTWKAGGKHLVTAGGEYRHLAYDGTRLAEAGKHVHVIENGGLTRTESETEMDFAAAYIQDEWRPSSRWLIVPAFRYDWSSRFGAARTPRIGVTYEMRPDFRLKANYGRGFRAPTLSELYMNFDGSSMVGIPGVGMFYLLGNPSLKPEKSINYEFSAEGEKGRFFGRAAYFDNHVKNLINLQIIQVYPMYYEQYYNIGKARIKGTEMSAGWHISPEWTFKAVWDHLDARDETARTRLPLRARDYGSLQLRYDGKRNGISAVLWDDFGRRFLSRVETASGTYRYKNYSYHLWNLSVSKAWGHLSVSAGLDNIGNRKIDDMVITGRMWRIGSRWSF
jgi:outer membrane receptor for ferrienterochelin and colicins